MANKSSLKSTIAVSLTNYLDAGAIVAGASGLTLWQNYLGLSEVHLGWLNFISANCLGAAIGAIIGGFLADKYGRKFIYTYNLIVYMVGVLTVMCSVNFPMLLAGFLITGISVGIGVPASWTYISESSEIYNRGRNICISQMSWGFGPMIILLLGMLFAPDGYLFSFRHALRPGTLEHIAIEGDHRETRLYVNGKLVETLGLDKRFFTQKDQFNIIRTLRFPLQRTDSFLRSRVTNLKVESL